MYSIWESTVLYRCDWLEYTSHFARSAASEFAAYTQNGANSILGMHLPPDFLVCWLTVMVLHRKRQREHILRK